MMSDTLFVLWIGLAAALLLLFLYAAFVALRNRQGKQVGLDELIPSFLPVDVEAFSELVTPGGNQSTTEELSPQQKRLVEQQRIRSTVESLRRMTHNAALLQRLGYGQLQSGNPLINDLAQQMIDAGVHVRLYSFIGLIALRVLCALRLASLPLIPNSRVAELQAMMSGSLVPAYQLLKDKAGNLSCLKFSGLHDALTQSL